jgi:CRISPR-associated protein Csm1
VAQLCRERNAGGRPRAYLIYAGGDDLFIVGAWSALPPLAAAVRDEFRALTGGDHVTLSAGIAIEQPKYPLYQLATDARRALDAAKACRREKNAISFLQYPVGWKQFRRADHWRDELTAMLADRRQGVPRAILAQLGEIHALYDANAQRQARRQRTGQITLDEMRDERHFAQWQWRLVHHLDRFGRRHPNHQEKIEQFQQEITREDGRLISLLRVIARWTELQTRENTQ